MKTSEAVFSIAIESRDYECDMEGIVNNGVYQNYYEHARHGYLKKLGLTFSALVEMGVNFVVLRAEVDYLKAIRSDCKLKVEVFEVGEKSPLRIFVKQRIVNETTGEISSKAIFYITAIDKEGRPSFPSKIKAIMLNSN